MCHARTLRTVFSLILMAMTVGCGDGSGNPSAPSATNAQSLVAASKDEGPGTLSLAAKKTKTEICHFRQGQGDYVLHPVNDKSLDSHLAHGDAFFGDAVPGSPGMVFNDTCTPVPAGPTEFSVSQTQVNFVTPTNQAPPDPITFVFNGLPTNPIGPGSLTVSGAIGDFAPGATESFAVSVDNGLINFGILYNNDPTDDLFDNASFGDLGTGSTTTGAAPATATIDLATLTALVADGRAEFLVVFGATVGDRPEESLTLTLTYPIP